MSKKKFQADCRANNHGGRWAGIPICVIESSAYRDLSLWARAILTEIVARMNGYNNGSIGISLSEICIALNNSNRGKAAQAIAELMQHGFIDATAEGDRKERLAREYRLTFVNTVLNGKFVASTEEYRDWQRCELPAKVVTKADRHALDRLMKNKATRKSGGNGALPEQGHIGNGALPEAGEAGNDALPDKIAKTRKSPPFKESTPSVSGNGASLLIYKPYPLGQSNGPRGNDGYHNQPEIRVVDFDAILRERLAAYWTGANRSERTRLAESIRLPVDELASFANGGHLPQLKAAPLMCELARTAA